MIRSLFWLPLFAMFAPPLASGEVVDDLAKVRSAATNLGVSDDAQQAWRRLATLDAEQLPALLDAMQDAGPLAENWLRMAIDAVAERQLKSGADLPTAALETFVNDTSQSPRARRTAFEWLTKVAPETRSQLLAAMVEDPSMSLRYDAVAMKLAEAEAIEDESQKKDAYRQLLPSVRNFKQFEAISAKLKELGDEVDLPGALGFLKNWQVIGPFDNTGLAHFDTAYPPESELLLGKSYDGKLGEVAWQPATADAKEGNVDFIAALEKEKEAVAYAFAKFIAEAGDAEIRYQSGCATKVWVNGQLVASNEVYHSGGDFDQYTASVTLRAGENTVLVKACQNEQRMPWERDWNFRLRVVDKLGTPIAEQMTEGVDSPRVKATR